MKKAFTLAELVIVFVIIGLLALIIMPTIVAQRPNKEKIMFKKAYFLTERIVSELTNDEDFYRNDSIKNVLADVDEVKYNGIKHSGKSKFCSLFATKVNTYGTADCNTQQIMTNGTVVSGNFVTTDGVVWILPIADFSSDTTPYNIYVDVNGDNEPNCLSGSSECKKPDRFMVDLYNTGRINVTGTIEKKYLKDEKVN